MSPAGQDSDSLSQHHYVARSRVRIWRVGQRLLEVGCESGARDVHGIGALGSAELFGQEEIVQRTLEGSISLVVVLGMLSPAIV